MSRETKTLPLADHTEEVVTGKAATCEEAGLTDGKKCSVCGETLLAQETIPALGHDVTDSYYEEQDGIVVFVEVCSREHNVITNTNIEIIVPGDLTVEHIIGVSDAENAHNVVITENAQMYEGSDVVFTSSAEEVVTVDSTNITVVGEGTAYITISYKGSNIKTFIVNVVNYHPVRTVEEFLAIGTDATTMAAKYKLMNDIDFEGAEVESLGTHYPTSSPQFKGVFDGQGHTLMNFILLPSSIAGNKGEAALFGTMSGSAVVKNLNLVSVKMNGYGGVIAAWVAKGSTIENCFIEVTITSVLKGDGTTITNGENGGAIAWRTRPGSIVKDCIAVITIAEGVDTTHYGAIVGYCQMQLVNCQAIVLTNNSLNVYATEESTNPASLENCVVYASIGEFYEGVDLTQYSEIWTFDSNKQVLPHLGTIDGIINAEDTEVYLGENIQLQAVSKVGLKYTLVNTIEGVTLTHGGLLTVADTVAADTVIEVLVTNYFGGQATFTVIVKTLTVEVTSVESITVEECTIGEADSIIVHNINVTQNGNAFSDGITYVSSDESVATVDSTNVNILGAGIATINVMYNGVAIHSFNVTVSSVWHPVRTAEEFLAIGTDATTMAAKYKLMNDIDFEGAEVESLATHYSNNDNADRVNFTGVFDGQGYTLKNFTLLPSSIAGNKGEAALFGYVNGATASIKNLNITGVKMNGYGGVIATWVNKATIENCFVEVTVTSMVKADGTAIGDKENGGAIAWRAQNDSIIKNCITVITIAEGVDGTWFGAIVGYNLTPIVNCQAIVLSGDTLKAYPSEHKNNTDSLENCAVYTSISDFYDGVDTSLYSDAWVFDVNKEELPYVGNSK